ncbi:hypothetical protein RUM43_014013 [Polyplax serrata]|uniref:NADPH:adrenodoxin oxidoreductase, mitochondrial n=1 Tax=Polyplax serrata TaxID=468196 RepID=A0AAN8NQR5_POLSC
MNLKMFMKLNKLLPSCWRQCSTIPTNPQICIVGGGPAGFYGAQRLVKLMPTATIDIIERLPVPFGLVRYGVAPDHADVKNVISTFTKTAQNPQVNFHGNLCLGRDFTLKDLQDSYHAVLLTYGAEEDRKLNIAGEELRNVISARRFVGWYNGLPADRDLKVDLDVENVVLIGQGNVAVDVARILLSSIEKLKGTDITEYALEQLSRSKVKNVYFVGRRGPLQIACTIKEIREMINLPNVRTIFDKNDFEGVDKIIPNLGRPRRRLTELLNKSAIHGKTTECDKTFNVIFKRTPLEFHGNANVTGVKLGVNTLQGHDVESQKAVLTEVVKELPCDLVLRSIGYKSTQVEPNIPFDFRSGIIVNKNGRIAPGLYCSGWVSTGPVGVILSTMSNAFATSDLIHKDISEKAVNMQEVKPGFEHMLQLAKNKGIQIVSFNDWEKIDREEMKRGKSKGKPREKIVSVTEMLSIAS